MEAWVTYVIPALIAVGGTIGTAIIVRRTTLDLSTAKTQAVTNAIDLKAVTDIVGTVQAERDAWKARAEKAERALARRKRKGPRGT